MIVSLLCQLEVQVMVNENILYQQHHVSAFAHGQVTSMSIQFHLIVVYFKYLCQYFRRNTCLRSKLKLIFVYKYTVKMKNTYLRLTHGFI